MSDDVATRLVAVRTRVADAARAAGRDPDGVALLLAVKTVDVPRVREAIAAGGTLLGHNRAQELAATEPGIDDLAHESHFIGRLQSNKAGVVARAVRCVQTVHDLALAQRLQRVAGEAGLAVMVQVNTSGEDSKSGVAPAAAADLAAAVADLPGLTLRGFMTIGAHSPDLGAVRASYEALAQVRDDVVGSGYPGTAHARELSMGMSGDLETAVAAGATMVRVGSAVFGSRPG